MPVFKIHTNAAVLNKESLQKKSTAFVAQLLGKSESSVMVLIHDSVSLFLGATGQSACLIELRSINLPREKTNEYSEKICAFIQQAIGVSPERTYIDFRDIDRNMFGWNSGNFER